MVQQCQRPMAHSIPDDLVPKNVSPNETDWKNWDVSPNFAPKELQAKSPQTWIAAAELDILCQEAENYGALLKQLNVNTTLVVHEGSTHSLLILDGMWPDIPFLRTLTLE
jgi:acetyl esterase/lipase